MSERIHRKDLKGPDEFVESASRMTKFIQENRNTVVAAAVGVTLVFVGGVSYRSYRTRTLDSTAAAFLRATDALESDNLESADTAMRTVVERNIQPYAEFARIYLADIQREKGNYAEAIAAYALAADQADSDYLKQIALIGKAYALELSQDRNQALLVYQSAGKIDGPHRQSALRSQLRLAQSAGKTELAREALTSILGDYPGVADAAELTEILEKLGG